MSEKSGEVVICFLLSLLVLPVISLWNGYALSILWGWFVVPVFSAPPLGVAAAIGIAIVASYLTYHYRHEPEHGSVTDRLATSIVWALVKPCFALALGYVVQRFL